MINENNEEDAVVKMLKQTGCINYHYKVQECMAATQDWRKCQDIVKDFKECMSNYTEQQRKKLNQVVLGQPLKLVLIVRADIKMSKGKIAAQCSHATVICYETCEKQNPKILRQWINAGQPKIVLKVDCLTDLENIEHTAKKTGIVTGKVTDAGKTEIPCGTVTVLGLGPNYSSNIDELVKHLRLL